MNEISAGDFQKAVRFLSEPWWKIWISEAKRKNTRGFISEALKKNPDFSTDLFNAFERNEGLFRKELRSLLTDGDASVIEIVASKAAQVQDVTLIRFLTRIFDELGEKAFFAIPVLLKWSQQMQDPTLENLRHITGDDTLDKALTHKLESENRPASHSLSQMELVILGWIRADAARALSKMGSHAKPHIETLRLQISKEKDESVRSAFENSIKRLERS